MRTVGSLFLAASASTLGSQIWAFNCATTKAGTSTTFCGRLGYDSFHATRKFVGWDVFGESGNSLVLGPYASATFKFTAEWSTGMEVRVPYYFSGGGLLLNQPYVLTQGQYHF